MDQIDIRSRHSRGLIRMKETSSMVKRTSISRQVKQSWITSLSVGVAALAVLATTGGILTAFGHAHRTFLSLRGQIVTLQGGGLYSHESVSMAAQGVGMDL